MKKFKSKYIPDATVFDKQIMICYIQTLLARYGKIIDNGKYKLELLIPFSDWMVITIYCSKKKPKIRNLYLLSILWFPFCLTLLSIIAAIILVVFILQIPFGFFYTCLFRKSFINDWFDTLCGYVSLVLSIIGIISIIKYFI